MKIEKLSVSYGENQVFNNLSLNLNDGEITCVLGRSGAGKTTLLKYLAGLIKDSGFALDGGVAMVFQEPRLLPNLTAYENLLFIGANPSGIADALKSVGLEGKENCRPNELSGGEKQRISFLRAMLSGANTVLLDEPFSSLDLATKIPLAKTFVEMIKSAKKTAIFVTHDVEEAMMVADRILYISGGEIALDIKLDGAPFRDYGAPSNQRKIIVDKITKSTV